MRVEFLDAAKLGAWRRDRADRILGEVHFGEPAPGVVDAGHPVIHVDMPQLNDSPLAEVWTCERKVDHGKHGNVRFSHNGAVMFAAMSDPVVVDAAAFEQRAAEDYQTLFAAIEKRGYPNLLRAWNYFPHINDEALGLENYRRFCRGRGLAFQQHFGDVVRRFPSASVLGTRGGPLQIYALASVEPGTFRENPRQVSAYQYPPEYGPHSPTFARATLKRWDGVDHLYISGTASIVGHESRHPGDCAAQLDETLRNIEALLSATRHDERCGFAGLKDLTQLKVYLRDATFLPGVQARLREVLAPHAQTIYLQADVCRGDLLVEIEAVAMASSP